MSTLRQHAATGNQYVDWLAQELGQTQTDGRQHNDPSALWALQQFWQRSAAGAAQRAQTALHPESKSCFP